MDRRNALLALCVVALFACEDERYGSCKKNGCESKERRSAASWGANDFSIEGSVTLDGTTHHASSYGSVLAKRTGFELSARSSEDVALAEEEEDAGSDAGADAGSYGYGGYSGYTPSYDTSRKLRVSFDVPEKPGTYRLEELRASAVGCKRGSGIDYSGGSACVDAKGNRSATTTTKLEGTLEWLDVRTDDLSAEGAPIDRPYELPWGWAMKTTNADLVIDLRATSRPTWNPPYDYCK